MGIVGIVHLPGRHQIEVPIHMGISPIDQWPIQEPKLEVPTIYKANGLGKAYVREYTPQNMALYGTVPPF
jgi:hypothetical protein